MNDSNRVYSLLQKIPRGKITTYKQLAIAIDKPTYSRIIGKILSRNKHPNKYPCYKVIMSNGSLGGYTSPKGVNAKIRRLTRDGICVRNGKIIGFRKLIHDFS